MNKKRGYRKPTTAKRAGNKRWRQSYKGYASKTYNDMKRRVAGRHYKAQIKSLGRSKGSHLYIGLPIEDREDFLEWVFHHSHYPKLHEQWVASGYCTKFSPSIDRIDPQKGYVFGNMQWLTHSDNAKKGHLDKTIMNKSLS